MSTYINLLIDQLKESFFKKGSLRVMMLNSSKKISGSILGYSKVYFPAVFEEKNL